MGSRKDALRKELEELKRQDAADIASSDGPSRAESALRGAGQGLTFGNGDEINGAVQAGADSFLRGVEMLRGEREKDFNPLHTVQHFLQNYRNHRDAERRDNSAAENAHRGFYVGGNLLGGLATAPLLPGAGAGKTLGQLALQGLGTGAATGAAYGLGSSNADLTLGDLSQFGRAALDTGASGLLGGVLGAALPPAGAALRWTGRNVLAPIGRALRGGYVTPTPEAGRLANVGAELTLGQMDPNSTMGRMEELASSEFTGSGISGLRDRGISTTRDALLQKAAAPGATPPTRGAPVFSQVDEIGAGFSKAYEDALGDAAINGAADTDGAFRLAAESVKDASPSVRRRALAWLDDKAQALMPAESGTVEAKSVQALRTQLRDKIRGLGDQGEDRQLREIYGHAESFVTDLLDQGLPPEKAAMLRALDGSYRNKMAVTKAANTAKAFKEGEGGEFTATQLLEAIRQGGATPELEALTRDAHRALTARYAPTGLQGHALNAIPGAKYAAQPLSYLANTVPFLRAHALNQMVAPGLPSRALSATGRGIVGAAQSSQATSPTARTLYELMTRPPPLAAVAQADDEPLPPWAVAP